MSRVLVLGSAPSATEAAAWPRATFDHIVVINNAWQVRPDWSHLIHPEDFPIERRPTQTAPGQSIITADDYVPAQNTYGGFVYAGGTMAFTAGYWALAALRPQHLCYFGCDMVYSTTGQTHFYGTGTADPLRDDVTLTNLPAKARRLQAFAAQQGCAMVNLSTQHSVLPYPRATPDSFSTCVPLTLPQDSIQAALKMEEELGYFVESGRYWEEIGRFAAAKLGAVDAAWMQVFDADMRSAGAAHLPPLVPEPC